MKKLAVVALVAALGLGMVGTQAVEAGGWRHHSHHHRGWHCGDVLFGAAVALTGIAVLDALLSPEPRVVYTQPAVVYSPPPVYYAPPPVVYTPPPVVYTRPVVVPPVCRPVHVVPRVIYQQPVFCPPPRPAYPHYGGWRR